MHTEKQAVDRRGEVDRFNLYFGFRNELFTDSQCVVDEEGRINPEFLFVFEQLGSWGWGK